MQKRKIIAISVVIAVVLASASLFVQNKYFSHAPTLEQGTILPVATTLPKFHLIDSKRHPFTDESFKGHWSIVFFGFTSCPVVCPTTLMELKNAYQIIKDRDATPLPRVTFISIDPQRDSPEKIGPYLKTFNRKFIGVTGKEAAIEKLTRSVGIAYAKAMKSGEKGYQMNHSGTLLVIAPDGKWVAVLTTPHHAKNLAADYASIVNYYE